jgi:hypothetical protein
MAKRRTRTSRSGAACKCLPSGDAAHRLVADPSLETAVVALGTMALRGALVATGLFIAGARGNQLLGYTVAATAAIEAGVITWAATHV